MTSRGEVVEPVSGPDLAEVAGRLAGAAVQAVAICFLHAWANLVHEQQAAAVLSARLPGVAVVTSHQVSGQWRGEDRASPPRLSGLGGPRRPSPSRPLPAFPPAAPSPPPPPLPPPHRR